MRGAQPHLNKLRASKPGTYDALQRKLEEIQANLPSYPLVLTLEEQGLFALGYYHQRAQDRAERSAYAEAKKAAAEKAE
jgi:CRISPR-associated protein Csd1